MKVYQDGFCISTDFDKLNLRAIHHFLSTEAYWCLNIPFEKVKKAAENSLNFGLYDPRGQQIGYARVISDRSTIAYLGDVYVLPEFRGRGLSKWLIGTVMQHPELQGLRRWILLTGDAHGLYRQFGWAAIAHPERWMEVTVSGPPYPLA
ncbi:GNAT family N-acetyltransferase [Puia dinghuensis]|uniref:N-acetyltransferase n=1 Tax=Puia dinghuensis TaxID=1792502 RepID=A0A8J2UHD5_9BACT|nr:GNAT family N-acetyltransferase [Puia dinghuensis]GGB18037.1 N-acetyltransferase [Puia dinghuensis]